jgi:hypothetical protein
MCVAQLQIVAFVFFWHVFIPLLNIVQEILGLGYFSSRPLTIFITSLECYLRPMGMAKSIGFLVSFPNINSNKNIFVAKCVVEFLENFTRLKCSP